MTDITDKMVEQLTRPIVGIENRTAREAFDIMADRFRAALYARPAQEPVAWMIPGTVDVATNAELDYRGPEHSKKVRAIYTQPLYASPQPALSDRGEDSAPSSSVGVELRQAAEKASVTLGRYRRLGLGDDVFFDDLCKSDDALRAAPPASNVEPVAWRVIGGDGASDVTERHDIAEQWREDGLAVTLLVPAGPPSSDVERRKTFVIPDGHEAVRDADGRATGETRPIQPPVDRSGVPQDISTAPANTDVLVWWPIVKLDEDGDPTEEVVGGCWLISEDQGGHWIEPDVMNAIGDHMGDDHTYADKPSQWMPLPTPLFTAAWEGSADV